MENKYPEYSIGLDIGVGSVGWACITPEFELLKYQGRLAIGSREFTAAKTAEERRVQRGTRRRYNRRIKRIQLLQQSMEPLFHNDPTFFIQHEENEKHFWRNSNHFRSNTLSETLKLLGKNSRTYPTIYHLRHDLISTKKKFNPRLIYLALHHLTKFRGHFLNENMKWSSAGKSESIIEHLNTYFNLLSEHGYATKITQKQLETIEEILMDKEMNASDKRTGIIKLIGKEMRQPLSLIIGLKANIAQLFPESESVHTYKDEKLGINLSTDDITENYEKLTEAEKLVIDQANIVYQGINLHDLLGTARYVSEAKVFDYNQFGDDLSFLKRIYNDYLGEKKYRDMFITSRSNLTKYKQTQNADILCEFDRFLKDKKNYESKFYTQIRKVLSSLLEENKVGKKDRELLNVTIERIKKGQFLLKQKTYLNAAIPNQNNVYEAEMIMKNQQKYYPEITDKMIENIKKIISFRIPYYIGPLVKEHKQSEFAWLIRKKEDTPILPWNIDEVIDRSASAEAFIQRMTGYCMYLLNERVLPKHSLLYERFELLNELNGIQIRSDANDRNRKYRLSADEKQWIINHVFKHRKNVTVGHLQEALKKSESYKYLIIDKDTDSLKTIYGTQKENAFSTNLSTYIDMVQIFGHVDRSNIDMIEELIYWITVFEDKDIVEMKIKEKYPEITVQQTKQLLRLNYTGWGRLSRKLLDGIPADRVNNKTIIEIMESEAKVFMEILHIEKYDLNERISKMNLKSEHKMTKINYNDIANLQGSPALKKGIWQAILIIEELVDIFGEPKNIMIEFARTDGVKKRSETGKQRITRLRKNVSKEDKDLKEFLSKQLNYDEATYRNVRMNLYINQEGKCLYSGETLNPNRLQDYEVDHIFPSSFVHDNSIDNLALVKQKMNAKKGGSKMPLEIIPPEGQYKQKMTWKKLYKNGLMSNKKYYRLLKESFTNQDRERFFARQLVETRQITRHVKDLLEERFENVAIHTVNAEVVTNLRKHSQIVKVRDLNSKHHSVDAALSAIIVQFILNKYGHNFLDFNFKYQEIQKKWRNLMIRKGKDFFLYEDMSQFNEFPHFKVKKSLSGREFFRMLNDEVPWQTTKKIGPDEGAFYKETLHSPKKKQNPKYKSPKMKHGVYDEVKGECTYLISYKEENKRGKIIYKSEFVDLYIIEKHQYTFKNESELAMFLAKKIAKGRVIAAKIHTKIEKYQKIEIEGYPFYYISSNELHNARQLQLPSSTLNNLYKVIDSKYDETIDVDFLQNVFSDISKVVINDYKGYLPDKHREKIDNYAREITDIDIFNKSIEDLFKTTSASAARSTLFGYRYTRKVDPKKAKFVHESVTGLRRRKPKSYRHELWSL